MSDTVKSCVVKFGADTNDFQKGTKEVVKQLTDLNIEYHKNAEKIKEINNETKLLNSEQKNYQKTLSSGKQLTEEETKKMQENAVKIEKLIAEKAGLKAQETELKAKISNTAKAFKEQSQEADKNTASVSKASEAYSKLTVGLKALAATFVTQKAYSWLIQSNAQMEQYVTSFTTLLGSAEKAQKLMNNLNSFAAKTPLEITDITSVAQTLLNYGVSENNLMEKLQQLGDLSSGNAQKFQSVALAYGQMLAAQRVGQQDLNQMINAGVPILGALAKAVGVADSEIRDMVSKGKVGINDLNTAIQSMTNDTGQFSGMMENQSQTLNGMLSTLSDNFAQIGREIGEEAFEEIKSTLQEIMDMINEASENGTLSEIADTIGSMISGLVKAITGIIKIIWNMRNVIKTTIPVLISLKAGLNLISLLHNVSQAFKVLKGSIQLANAEAVGFGKDLVSLSSLIKTISATPAFPWIAGASVAVGAITVLIANMETSEKKAKRLQKEYENLENEINDLKSESEELSEKLKTNQDRIDELHGKKKLTLIEEDELKKLEKANDELKRQIALLKEKQEADQKEAAKTKKEQFDTEFGSKEYERINSISEQEKHNADVEKYNQLEEQQQIRQLTEEQAKEWAYLKNSIYDYNSEHADNFNDHINQLIKSYEELYAKRDNLSEYEKKDLEKYKKELVETSTKLDEYVKDYGIDDETSQSWHDLSVKISNTKGLISGTNKELENTNDISDKNADKFQEDEDKADKFAKSLGDVSNAYDILEKAQKEYKENGYLTASTVEKIKSNHKELIPYITRTKDGYKLTVNALNSYTDAQVRNYKTALYNAKSVAIDVIEAETGKRMAISATTDEIQRQLKAQMAQMAAGKSMSQAYALEKDPKYQSLLKAYYEIEHSKNELADMEAYIKSLQRDTKIAEDKETEKTAEKESKTSEKEVKKEISIYEKASEAFKKLCDDKINGYQKQAEAAEKAAEKEIAAIDEMIQKRKEAKEDDDIQEQINAVNAQLKYAQLDDFSRMELQKQLKELQKEKEETEWQRAREKEKEDIQKNKENNVNNINALIEKVKAQQQNASQIFTDLNNGYKSATTIVNNNSRSANVNIVQNALSNGQIARAIIDELMGVVW